MYEKITPEAAGVSSREVLALLRSFENRGLRMHSVLIGKGDKLFAEYYWAPFDRDFKHRMYSQTKSYVSAAVGILAGEGKIDLDAPIASYFPEKIDAPLPPYLAAQTVREMLCMQTSIAPENWFYSDDPDRTHLYFNRNRVLHPAGTAYAYDSAGSQVLTALVEKVSGQALFDFLTERIFRHLDTFHGATILKTRNGDSWGDSALICTPRDMMSFGRLLIKGGKWNGKQLIPADYLKEATRRQTATEDHSGHGAYGYGYQIWMTEREGCYAFFGMGGQFTICMPDKDLIFVCTADNQGYAASPALIFGGVFDRIYDTAAAAPLPEDPEAYAALEAFGASLSLYAPKNVPLAPEDLPTGEYRCLDNPIGITSFSLVKKPDGTGEFRYHNAQGDKVLPFGFAKNVFTKFPQFGYSDGVGGAKTDNGFLYRCAAAGAWASEKKFNLFVQVIDRYFGNLKITFSFKGDVAVVTFCKNAEAFMDEYNGELIAEKV